MAKKLDDKELVSFKEMIMANSVQLDTIAQLLIERGIFSEDEFYAKLREVLLQYEGKGKGSKDKLGLVYTLAKMKVTDRSYNIDGENSV